MDNRALISATSLNDVEMSSTQEVTNRSVDKVSVPEKHVERKKQKKEIKKKTDNVRKKKLENKTAEEKTVDSARSTTVCGDANESEHKNLGGKDRKQKATDESERKNLRGKGLKRKTTIEEQSENGIEQETANVRKKKFENKAAEEKTVDNAGSTTDCEDANKSEHTNLDGKGLKKKVTAEEQSENGIEQETVNVRKKTFENKATEEKTVDNTGPTTISGHASEPEHKNIAGKRLKRKAPTEMLSENGNEQETEDDRCAENRNANKNLETENDNSKSLKIKIARKSANTTDQKTEEDLNTVDTESTVEENKINSAKESTNKTAGHPPISEMVLNFFEGRRRKGTSAEEISKFVEENYQVNINRIKPHIKKFLQKGVADGLFDQVSGSGVEGKFKVRKTVKSNTETAKVKKAVRKVDVTKVRTENVKKTPGKLDMARKTAANAKKSARKVDVTKKDTKNVKKSAKVHVAKKGTGNVKKPAGKVYVTRKETKNVKKSAVKSYMARKG